MDTINNFFENNDLYNSHIKSYEYLDNLDNLDMSIDDKINILFQILNKNHVSKEIIQLNIPFISKLLSYRPLNENLKNILSLQLEVNMRYVTDDESIQLIEHYLFQICDNYRINIVLGMLYSKTNKINKAITHTLLSLYLNKTDDSLRINAYINLFLFFYNTNEYNSALQYTLKANEEYPNNIKILERLALVYYKLDDVNKTDEYFKLAIKQIKNDTPKNDLATLYSNYSFFKDRTFDYEIAEKLCKISYGFDKTYIPTVQTYSINLLYKLYDFESRFKVFNVHKEMNELYKKTKTYNFDNHFKNSDKINIGFTSGDLRLFGHAIMYFMSTFFLNYNKNLFNVICYSQAETFGMEKLNVKYTKSLSTEELSDMVYNDNIHILIDLSGFTSDNRLDVYKNKPAPIQITYLGYPATTGIDEMNYRITDTICEYNTEISQEYYTEKLICMDHCFLCYDNYFKPKLEEKSCDYLRIGCFNRPNKISKECLSLFERVLKENDTVQFYFNSPAHNNPKIQLKFLNKFDESVRSRINFISSKGKTKEEHLLTYNQIDIQIDTFPYSGTTTSCESLLMGVPSLSIYDTITCFHVRNVTVSLLKNSNLDYFVCSDEQEVLNKVKELQTKDFTNFKKEIRDKFINGKACNKSLYMENIQRIFIQLYNKHINVDKSLTNSSITKEELLFKKYINRDWEVNFDIMPLQSEELECVIIEPRCHENLPGVIMNFMSKLNKYSFTLYCSKENENYLFGKVPNKVLSKLKRIVFTEGNINISDYNSIMVNPIFWNSFKSKRVLIFQTDTCLFHSNIEKFLKYTYIGAPWPQKAQDNWIFNTHLICGNGGLSLRDPIAMKEICENKEKYNKFPEKYNKFPEDIYFSMNLYSDTSFILPQSIKEASEFSSEIILDYECFGSHSVYKYNSYENLKSLF